MIRNLPFILLFCLSPVAHADWQAHLVRQKQGKNEWRMWQARRQVMRHPDCEFTMPFGLVRMSNGEIALLVSREKAKQGGGRIVEPNIAFSKDGGANWSKFQAIPGTKGRPVFLTWLGSGRLMFATQTWEGAKELRLFSKDFGRTWKERLIQPKTKAGYTFAVEGNNWVDFDKNGSVKAIHEIGWYLKAGRRFPFGPYISVFRSSTDGGRTWINELEPNQWQFNRKHKGKTWVRGTSEGSLVRAANGDLIAALRTDMPPGYFEQKNDDSLEGTAISISRDNGRTWSKLNHLFGAGRHHANLQRLPNGHLVCTVIVRQDIWPGKKTKANGKLTSLRRGCDAVISRDHGRTWQVNRRYELDGFEFLRPDGYYLDGKVGHLSSVALPGGDVLTVYGDYRKGAVLVRWKPGGHVRK